MAFSLGECVALVYSTVRECVSESRQSPALCHEARNDYVTSTQHQTITAVMSQCIYTTHRRDSFNKAALVFFNTPIRLDWDLTIEIKAYTQVRRPAITRTMGVPDKTALSIESRCYCKQHCWEMTYCMYFKSAPMSFLMSTSLLCKEKKTKTKAMEKMWLWNFTTSETMQEIQWPNQWKHSCSCNQEIQNKPLHH